MIRAKRKYDSAMSGQKIKFSAEEIALLIQQEDNDGKGSQDYLFLCVFSLKN